MSSNKKRRELNRAIEEHEIAKLASSSNNAFNAAVWKAGAEKLQADNDQLRSELAALKAENEWQPIETAPKDGTSVLAWLQHTNLPGAIYFSSGKWYWVISGGWAGFPTHWMPLPKPPARYATIAEGKQRCLSV